MTPPFQSSVASEHGKGWRSKAALKKANRASRPPSADVYQSGGGVTDGASPANDYVDEGDVQARLNVIETSLRAQAEYTRNSGKNWVCASRTPSRRGRSKERRYPQL
jgi:hypothetical protein